MSTATVGSFISWWKSVGKIAVFDPKEFEADCFASALLMPRTAVLKGLGARGWNSKTLLPEQAYALASLAGRWLWNVSFKYASGNAPFQSLNQAAALEKFKRPQIRKSILGQECKEHLVVVDEAWFGRAIDVQVDDLILLPAGSAIEGGAVTPVCGSASGCLVRAVKPGVGGAFSSDGHGLNLCG